MCFGAQVCANARASRPRLGAPATPSPQPISGQSYGQAATVTVELPAPQVVNNNYYNYDTGYSPYAGYNPYMPSW